MLLILTQNLSAIVQENASGSEEASAAIEEKMAALEEIANASDSLAQIAVEMKVLIQKNSI